MRPGTVEEAATLLRERSRALRPVGGGTKPWPASDEEQLQTGGLNRILEHNVGDFTAVLEAGVPFAEAQAAFAAHRQRLAWDPPDLGGATIGGIVATADSGPLRHRYGGVRDLVVGMTVVLSDGTVARSGGKVIKNVAGYDVAKLFAGSFGTLGLIASVAVRLHPLPDTTATVAEAFDDPDALLARVLELARRPLEAERFDVVWSGSSGRLLVQFAGASARAQAARIGEVVDEDWAAVAALQRAELVLKVAGRVTDLPAVLRAGGTSVVSRAGLGLSWVAFDDVERLEAARAALAPRACTVLDGAARVASPWPDPGPGFAVMERLKARFDPARIFRPGAFVGGI